MARALDEADHPARKLAVAWVVLTVLALFFASQLYFAQVARGAEASFGRTLLLQLSRWYLWGALTPLIFALGRRWEIERRTLVRALARHVVCSVLVVLLYLAAYSWIYAIVYPLDPVTGSRGALYATFFFSFFHWELVIYWSLLGLAHGLRYYRRFRDGERRTMALETEFARARLNALRMQLQPHFLFNTLHSVASLVRADDNKGAIQMIVGLSDLLRDSLDRSKQSSEVPLREEIDFVERYLRIERVRYRDRLDVEIRVPEELRAAKVPFLILQPLVENALVHGVTQSPAPGRLAIVAQRANGELRLEVVNDGPSLPEGFSMEVHAGLGLETVEARLRLMGSPHPLVVENRDSGGVRSIVRVPYREGSELPVVPP